MAGHLSRISPYEDCSHNSETSVTKTGTRDPWKASVLLEYEWRRCGRNVTVCVRALNWKRLELSAPNVVHVYPTADPRHGIVQKVKGQGHTVIKCSAGVGMQVDILQL